MNRYLFSTAVAILMSCTVTQAQNPSPPASSTENFAHLSLGLGFGQDYGGIGANITVYPQRNIGLFLGGGYAVAGFGYNAGIKLRLLASQGHSLVRPFIEGMYGYNAAVAVTNYSQYNKIFYGPSAGFGVDIGSAAAGRGNLSLAIIVPFRSQDVNAYINELNANGVAFGNSLSPVTFSIGYKFGLN